MNLALPNTFKTVLDAHGYVAVPLHWNSLNHLELHVTINEHTGRFVLDTGASMTCLDKASADRFGVALQDSVEKASGVGPENMNILYGLATSFSLGSYTIGAYSFAVIDFSHLNENLVQRGAKPVDGVLGGDILNGSGGLLDYTSKTLFLAQRRPTPTSPRSTT